MFPLIMLNKVKITREALTLVKASGVVLLLFFYVLGSGLIESFHSQFHEHQYAQFHTDKNESDPCHISLFHHVQSGGCDHSVHFTEEDKCSLCDSQLHDLHILVSNIIRLPSPSLDVVFIDSLPKCVTAIVISASGRAPPL